MYKNILLPDKDTWMWNRKKLRKILENKDRDISSIAQYKSVLLLSRVSVFLGFCYFGIASRYQAIFRHTGFFSVITWIFRFKFSRLIRNPVLFFFYFGERGIQKKGNIEKRDISRDRPVQILRSSCSYKVHGKYIQNTYKVQIHTKSIQLIQSSYKVHTQFIHSSYNTIRTQDDTIR